MQPKTLGKHGEEARETDSLEETVFQKTRTKLRKAPSGGLSGTELQRSELRREKRKDTHRKKK